MYHDVSAAQAGAGTREGKREAAGGTIIVFFKYKSVLAHPEVMALYTDIFERKPSPPS